MMANTGAGETPAIRIEGVSKSFGGVPAVAGVSLDIARGEFFCLVGASGSGKTTLLRLIAGFETPDSGRVLIDGEDMTSRPPYARPVNMMFQSYALFPHLTVADNVAFGLEEERRPRNEIRERVSAALAMFDMGTYGARKPHQLSGGQRQRVALARALVKNPKILLLDEPLGALDKKLRERAQLELVALRERVGITFVMVTHDQEEAMSMASRIALMRDGALCQVGTPRELYDAPQSRFAADFFGVANLFGGRVTKAGAAVDCTEVWSTLAVKDDCTQGADVTVMVRPEHIALSKDAPAQPNVLAGTLGNIVFLGNAYVCYVTLETGKTVQARLGPADMARLGAIEAGDAVYLSWDPAAARVLTS
ncbi:MAG TPA: ABC transporter ATP-binding protein [Pseudolabrys sp.]|nr:ABC transporter ATP-binding protein [Pseudolabrys sp.]